MGGMDFEGRDPCPRRIISDIGGAFSMGYVGGNVWYFGKGFRQGVVGSKFKTGIASASLRAPIAGGNFGLWMTVFASFDCTLGYLRGKDDSLNAIASGFCTGGMLAMRGGVRAATYSAIFGGIVLAGIEGIAHLLPLFIHKATHDHEHRLLMEEQAAQQAAQLQSQSQSSL